MSFREPEQQEDGMGRKGCEYWMEQLSEYWESGLTIQKHRDLKELPYESVRRWIRVLQKARPDDTGGSLDLVEVASAIPSAGNAPMRKLWQCCFERKI